MGPLTSSMGVCTSRLAGEFEDINDTKSLTGACQQLVAECSAFEGGGTATDHHVHILGLGTGGSGCIVHEKMQSSFNLFHATKLSIFMKASGVTNRSIADEQYIERVIACQQAAPGIGRMCLLAFSHCYKDNGEIDMKGTGLATPNNYILKLHQEFPDITWPVGSVHPYKPNAIQELTALADAGVRMIKWLPNSMNINPADPRCVPYYDVMSRRGMTLLSHTGEEHSVDAGGVEQALGNPLLLRYPLNAGVTVIAAHCATEGVNPDLDFFCIKGKKKPKVENFDLFMRIMGEPQYDGLLFGDISAIIAFRRVGRYTKELLEAKHIHHRLVYGSDYPVPCVNMVVHTGKLGKLGFITEEEVELLNELYRYNPLMFDLAVKRCLKSPDDPTAKFPDHVFTRSLYGCKPCMQEEVDDPTDGEEGCFGEDAPADETLNVDSSHPSNGAGSGMELDPLMQCEICSEQPVAPPTTGWSTVYTGPALPCFITHALEELDLELVSI